MQLDNKRLKWARKSPYIRVNEGEATGDISRTEYEIFAANGLPVHAENAPVDSLPSMDDFNDNYYENGAEPLNYTPSFPRMEYCSPNRRRTETQKEIDKAKYVESLTSWNENRSEYRRAYMAARFMGLENFVFIAFTSNVSFKWVLGHI